MENDKLLISRAIEIAERGIGNGSGPFGAVVSKNGKIISEANNSVVSSNDPTAHAEILAIRQAASILKSHNLEGCTLYSSCEPCPMCLGAIYWAGIKRVVYDCDRIDAAEAGFNDDMIYDQIVLDPSEREITFLQIDSSRGKEVLRRWKELENKIPY